VTLIAVAAGKGAPGVTTISLALAAVWPRPALLAECDPAGGDIVYALRSEAGAWLAADRGIVSLATALRMQPSATDVLAHAQVVDGGLPVLVGVPSASHAQALAGSWRAVGAAMAQCPADVFADCGRLGAGPGVDGVIEACDRLLLVCRATPAGVAHTRSALELVRSRYAQVPLSVVVIGGDDASQQVASALRGFGELDVLGPVAFDATAAAGLAGRWTRRLDRSQLVVSARVVARAVDARLPHQRDAGSTASEIATPPLSEVG
jgi:MinD-like ATPase involved in chromosome partitioning or flagellar assembly